MKKKINVGVIGLGVGLHHLNTYMQDANCSVIQVCDFSNKKLNKISNKYKNSFSTTTNAKKLIDNKNIDLVSIASYDNFHYQQIIECIKNKKHIFVEKPLCLSFDEMKSIKKLLVKHPKIKISCNFVLRTAPIFSKFKRDILKKKYGEIFNIEANYMWGRKEKFNGWRKDLPFYSKILGAGVHMLDLVTWMLNDRPISVFSSGNKLGTKNINIKYNTFVSMIFQFRNNLIVNIGANGPCLYPHSHEISIYSDLQTTKLTSQGLLKTSKKKFLNKKLDKIKNIYPRKELRSNILKNFIGSILNNKKNLIPKKQIFDVMSACLAAEESMKKNKLVKIKYL
mgnify:CR=1 FL=1